MGNFGLFPLFCVCLLIYLSEAAFAAAVLGLFFFGLGFFVFWFMPSFFAGGGQSVIWPKRGHGNLAALLFMQQPAAVYVHVRFGHVFAPSNTCSSCFPFSASFSNIGCQMSPLGAVHMPREKPTKIQTKLTHKKQWSISCFFPGGFSPL